ncbi:CPBP family intramembrane glutamic endopeptidase [Tenacibaculum sp. SG-28]|uniref:CPBP family intramembrane glutamic endopeptidase n=1 Tax=Tenacibaculum sp. SG-28 TaxID=754426 RepID=UPI000CF45AF3|nr:CPBP family intramembrane glutamic endopeptidase [Tenacibaculum sp. SG-28]PQJ20604.1 abortive infection protein [Tenacibaculum sp. SG-28]
MNKNKFWNQLVIFVISLLAIVTVREYFSYQLIEKGIDSYQIHTFLSIGANLFLILLSYFLIKKNGLTKIAGLKGTKLEKVHLLIFPLFFLVLLNVFLMDDINTDFLIPNILVLIIFSISIGFAEELSIRGFLQSHLIHHFGKTKNNIILSVLASALFFGVLHLLNFDKGIYGELSQVCFATFVGIMFGFLLVITKRIYPLIIIHAIVDFVAKLDAAGIPIKEKIRQSMSVENSVYIVLLAIPCLIYGVFLMKSYKLT